MRVVGQPVRRIDGVEHVTGRTRYVGDLGADGMLHASTVRSPRPHVYIKNVDLKKAEQVPGYVRWVGAGDVPGRNEVPLVHSDHPVFADGECRFLGEAIGVIGATSMDAARAAAAAAVVQYEDLPAVTDALEAMEPDAPRVHGDDNLFGADEVVQGDADRALAQADCVVEGTFTTGYQAHACLETQGVLAVPQADGGMHVTGSLERPQAVHDAIARVLGVASSRVRVVQAATGGGFGGKEDVPCIVAAQAAVLAHVCRRPVQLVHSREEDFLATSKRHPSWCHVRLGATRDGRITALDMRLVLDCGAYSTLSPCVLRRAAAGAAGPYRIPDVRVRSYAVATHKVPCGAFRGSGRAQVCFALESAVDELAVRLSMDPLVLRRMNLPEDASCGVAEAVSRVTTGSAWETRRAQLARQSGAKRRGIGMSVCRSGSGRVAPPDGPRGPACAAVIVARDGSVSVACGQTETGQGARTALAQIAAEGLGCPYEAVAILEPDTTRVPGPGLPVDGRSTAAAGNAVLGACRELRARMDRVAADMQRAGPGSLTADFRDLAAECWRRDVPLACQSWAAPATTDARDRDGDGAAGPGSANVAEVEVDTETGSVTVLGVVAAHDAGQVIHPQQAEGQVEGAVAQGIGFALLENLIVDGGVMANGHLAGYVLPTAADCPQYRTILLARPCPTGPFGATGLGDASLIGVAPAIANAIAHACGARPRHLPITPEALHELICEASDRRPGGVTGSWPPAS
jgi:CO/xanthine dehydrogenase Mo-binding subunit